MFLEWILSHNYTNYLSAFPLFGICGKSSSLFIFIALLNAEPTHFCIPFAFSQALERISFGKSRIRDTVIAQNRILLFWYCTTYLLLEKNKPKYQQLEIPIDDIDDNTSLLKLEEINSEEVDQTLEAPPVVQVDSDQPPESPRVDFVGPFVLEGL